jgi:putative ABC transport system substrate-binding protein
MKRRAFITLLGGAAAWPVAASAQQPLNPVVGFLSGRSPAEAAGVVAAFRKGLSEIGFVEPQNVTIDFRWAEGQFDRLPALARELVDRPVAVIAALGGSDSIAKAITSTIPIVFGTGGDPVADGLVASLNRPGGNITGVTFLTAALGAKRLGLLRDLVPGARVIALLANPNYYLGPVQIRGVDEAARTLGQTLVVFDGSTDEKIEAAFAALAPQHVSALLATCTRAREKSAPIACSRSYSRSPTSRAPIRSRCSSSAIAWIRGNGRFLSSLLANTAIASSTM